MLFFVASRLIILIVIFVKLTGSTKDTSNFFLSRSFFVCVHSFRLVIQLFLVNIPHSFRLVIQLFLVNIPLLIPLYTSWPLYDFSLMREITNQALWCKYYTEM